MGGRRARLVAEVVGVGLRPLRVRLTRALGAEDPERIAASTAALVSEGQKASHILRYASELVSFLISQGKKAEQLSHGERMRLARKEWSRIKQRERLPDDAILTKAIVAAAAKALGTPSR